MNNKVKVAVISLGCDKNRVDTENILYRLVSGGFALTDDMSQADVIIINTCAFIESAEKEAIDNIFAAARLKTEGRLKRLIVAGCLPMRYGASLADLLPEVDAIVGMNDYSAICDIVSDAGRRIELNGSDAPTEKRILSTPPHYAYLKIAEGCDNHCTYCTIPSIRGRFRSRTLDSLVSEAKFLDGMGVGELILVAQDVTKYGIDIYGESRLTVLVRRLLSECSFRKIRLLYCYPESVTDELIDLIAGEERMAKYIDVPLQHIADPVLRRMGRRTTKAEIIGLFGKLKAKGIAVRTTLIVGFPGETEEQFEELCGFVKEYAPEHLGVFAYSKEDGTPAARMKEQIPKKEKLRRVNILGEIAKNQAERRNASMIGKVLDVVYEDIDYDRNMFAGRTEWDAPDVDARVYFTGKFADVGNVYKVRITGYDGYDLTGEMESDELTE